MNELLESYKLQTLIKNREPGPKNTYKKENENNN